MPIWAYSTREVCRAVCVLSWWSATIRQTSTALCEQVMALNFDRIIEHMGKVDEETLGRITEGV